MKTAGCGAAAAGKGCPSNGESSIQESSSTLRRRMIAFPWLLTSTKKQGRVAGRERGQRQGEVRAHAVTYRFPPFRGETEEMHTAL